MSTATRTGERVGRYHVYARGSWRWYRAEGGRPDQPEWYLWRDDADDDGEYVDRNPATWASNA